MIYNIIHTESSKEIVLEDSSSAYIQFTYILNGIKKITINDNCISYGKNELLYIKKKCIFSCQNIPEDGIYEEVVFYFLKEEIGLIIDNFKTKYGYVLDDNKVIQGCTEDIISELVTSNIEKYFETLILLLKKNFAHFDVNFEWIKKAELLFLLLSYSAGFISNKMFYDVKSRKDNFVAIMNENIFKKKTIIELSSICQMSLSTFKKEFSAYFKTSPHKWFVYKRLEYARFLLISTNKDIKDISSECCFDNISHFIKLFRGKFECTPLAYRNNIRNNV